MSPEAIHDFVYGACVEHARAERVGKSSADYVVRVESRQTGRVDILERGGIPKHAISDAMRGHILRAVKKELVALVDAIGESKSADRQAEVAKSEELAQVPTDDEISTLLGEEKEENKLPSKGGTQKRRKK